MHKHDEPPARLRDGSRDLLPFQAQPLSRQPWKPLPHPKAQFPWFMAMGKQPSATIDPKTVGVKALYGRMHSVHCLQQRWNQHQAEALSVVRPTPAKLSAKANNNFLMVLVVLEGPGRTSMALILSQASARYPSQL